MTETPGTFQIDSTAFQDILAKTRHRLLQARDKNGVWQGALSSSALATATAVTALAVLDPRKYHSLIENGLTWLTRHVNPDGGWGDSVTSSSNISTTVLVWSAFAAAGEEEKYQDVIRAAESWIQTHAGSLETEDIVEAIYRRYGRDRTFSVPILTTAAICGRLGQGKKAWQSVKPLPFELAVFPQKLWRLLRLPVVSYALPALIAMGLVRYAQFPPVNPITRVVRFLLRNKSLKVLKRIQPANGGFLEAAPLTSFVVISLTAAGYPDHPVVSKGTEFLVNHVRQDGSWPIDTNLSTWLTTLSVNALAKGDDRDHVLPQDQRESICHWLVNQQYRTRHPYTGADPGGWAWTDQPGGVPDADDTAGALLALYNLGIRNENVTGSVQQGIRWLLGLQNRDGGFPTFCRGWARLPFDRSCPDITAHVLRAFSTWLPTDQSGGIPIPDDMKSAIGNAIRRGIDYLIRVQAQEGYWLPLWFGNQGASDQKNPTYGTAKVITGLVALYDQLTDNAIAAVRSGVNWILQSQTEAGGWGGEKDTPPSIEETALALEALAGYQTSVDRLNSSPSLHGSKQIETAIYRGTAWLHEQTKQAEQFPSTPIGLYFAKLWYFEELYPILFALAAMETINRFQEQV